MIENLKVQLKTSQDLARHRKNKFKDILLPKKRKRFEPDQDTSFVDDDIDTSFIDDDIDPNTLDDNNGDYGESETAANVKQQDQNRVEDLKCMYTKYNNDKKTW